jgi:hypothetical protein
MVFNNPTDRISFAQRFLHERLDSLKKDVTICIEQTCPFPALLYCFSTIDLLGSLYEGEATGNTKVHGKRASPTRKAKKYMMNVMKYPKSETKLLQNQFRHKLVHLAQPNTITYDNSIKRMIGWRLNNRYNGKHMIVELLPSKRNVLTLAPYKMEAEAVFTISLQKLLEDILNSSHDYLEMLKNSVRLHKNFDDAICDVYDAMM